MAETISVTGALGIGKFNVGLGTVGNMLILVALATLIFILVGVAIWLWIRNKQFKYRIPLYQKIGNVPTRVAIYRAKEVPMGRAGDKLWFVAKVKKYIIPPTIQSAKREFFHWQREDGEWVNFAIGDLDEDSKKSGVKYVHQDMRMSRLAIDRLLEQRLMNQNFWEKYGLIISYVIFFLVITIALVIIFWQWGDIVERLDAVMKSSESVLNKALEVTGEGQSADLVPAFLLPFMFRRKKWLSLKTS